MYTLLRIITTLWIIYLPVASSCNAPPTPDLESAIQRGVTFLANQYNPGVGLLRESTPDSAREPEDYYHNHYLTNDNALAAYALETLGVESELSAQLRASLRSYGYDHNGFIEVAWGEPIRWPPYHHQDITVTVSFDNRVRQETHLGPGYFYDWSAYSNLAFMAALNEHNLGHHESALRLYEIEMSTFDGEGWRDKIYWERGEVYETIGLAWALYVGTRIGAPIDQRVVMGLLQKQGPSGGFHTHYRRGGVPTAYANVETTALALLGLNTYRRQVAVQRAVRYLQDQYSPAMGLLRESPQTQPHRYWLATDNRLAVYALEPIGTYTQTAAVTATLQRYGDRAHGLIEVLEGQIVAWPPYTPTQTLMRQIGPEQVWLEQRLTGNRMNDWAEYADLALLGALRAHHSGSRNEAHGIYQVAMQMWDGVGFADKAYRADGLYATYKLALAVYTATVLGEPVPADVLSALLAQQALPGVTCGGAPCGGGFYALYNARGLSQGDTSTETTAYAIQALSRQ